MAIQRASALQFAARSWKKQLASAS